MELGAVVDGRYRVDALLGGGAMGQVFRATDVELERACCLKVVHGSHPDFELRTEARALAGIRHENVVGVYGFGHHAGQPYLAMEYVHGHDLGWLIFEHYRTHHAPIPVTRAMQIVRSLCDGLSAVHGAGIVHRDIKPQNVILEKRTGRAVLVDFGAAVGASWMGGTRGTPHYMPPEAFVGAPPSPQTDLYSLGCVAFELLTGSLPYDGDELRTLAHLHTNAQIPRVSAFRPELAQLDVLFDSVLAKNPRARPSSAAMLGNLFEDTLAGQTDPGSSEIATATDGIRILVVDDDPTFARMAARCVQVAFADTHVSVKRVATAAAALESALARRPDLVLLDYSLPDSTGVEVLSTLRAHHGHHTEALIASGALGQKERWRFQILGVTEFVDKPVDFQALVSLLHHTAASRAWIPR
ncbi:MAG: protein kinase [Deltaproteobacteria bacterium]|nr:protein kinase [Deltaproteobacteria bacterium]